MERERAIQVVLALAAVSSDEDDINDECRFVMVNQHVIER